MLRTRLPHRSCLSPATIVTGVIGILHSLYEVIKNAAETQKPTAALFPSQVPRAGKSASLQFSHPRVCLFESRFVEEKTGTRAPSFYPFQSLGLLASASQRLPKNTSGSQTVTSCLGRKTTKPNMTKVAANTCLSSSLPCVSQLPLQAEMEYHWATSYTGL